MWALDARSGSVAALKAGCVHGTERSADEFEGSVQSVCVPRARIHYVNTQLHAGQQTALSVDLVHSEKHGFQSLDAAIVDGVPTRGLLSFDVDGKQSTKDDVARQLDRRTRSLYTQC